MAIIPPKHWYVYLHLTDEGEPYYCGKGTGDRDEFVSRNRLHDRIAKVHGFNVQRLASFIDENEAYVFEIETIARFRLNRFAPDYKPSTFATNMDAGGHGRRQYRYTDEQLVNHKIKMNAPEVLKRISKASKEVQNRPDVRRKKSKLRCDHTKNLVANIDEIISRMNAGESQRHIAKTMDISHSTLTWHVNRYLKGACDVHTNSQ